MAARAARGHDWCRAEVARRARATPLRRGRSRGTKIAIITALQRAEIRRYWYWGGRPLFTIMTNGTRERHGRVNYTLTAVGRVTHRRRRPIALGPGLVVREGRTRSYFEGFRRSLFQNPGRHLWACHNYSCFIIAVPPCIIIIYSRIYGNNTFSAVVPGRAEIVASLVPHETQAKPAGHFLEPPHPMIRAPRADGTVYARSLCLSRLERSWVT